MDFFYGERGQSTFAGGLGVQNLDELLKHDLSGPTITALAEEAVTNYGDITLRHIDNALNNWHSTWHFRHFREMQYEENSFCQNPMPFWWLAKLYLLLHCYRYLLNETSDFVVMRAAGADCVEKLQTQSKVGRWLSNFRGPQLQPELLAGNFLCKLTRVAGVNQHGKCGNERSLNMRQQTMQAILQE